MSKLKITGKEWAFVGIMTLLAIIFTNEYFLRFLASLNSFFGFMIYYIILYGCLTVMAYAGLVVFGIRIKKPLQIIGTGLIIFAFFLIFDWSSDYLNLVNASNGLINNSEDALSWDFWTLIINPTTDFLRWLAWALAFPLTVFIFTLIGVILNSKKPRLGA